MKRPRQNILIVRTDRIGDVVLTTPALKALRVAYPEAKISILLAPVNRGNFFLETIVVLDFLFFFVGGGGRGGGGPA